MKEDGKTVALVRRSATQTVPYAQTAITIAVDTAYVVSQGGGTITQGIYMFDNRLTNGSKGEGTLELNSIVNLEDIILFDPVPVNPFSGDTVVITGFQISSGSVFGNQGYPLAWAGTNYWLGQAVNSTGMMTYQIQIKVTTGGIRPTSYYVTWDPFIGTN